MGYRVFEAQIEGAGIVFELAKDLPLRCLMVAVNEVHLATRLDFQGVPHSFAVGRPQPLFLGEFIVARLHFLTRRNPNSL